MIIVVQDNADGKIVAFTKPTEYPEAVGLLGKPPTFHLRPGLHESDIYPQIGYIGFRRERPVRLPEFEDWCDAAAHRSVGYAYKYKGWSFWDARHDFFLMKRLGETPWQAFTRIMNLRLT